MFTDFRIKFRHWIRKYGKILFLVLAIWGIIYGINALLRSQKVKIEPVTNFKPHVSVINDGASTPKSLQVPIEEMIEKYVGYCNDGNYKAAYNMISDKCKEIEFNNQLERFVAHVIKKMPFPKKYGVQSYSKTEEKNGMLYIYEVRYYDDYLASGLTNSTYQFTTEKFSFLEDKDGKLEMNVGDYIYSTPIKSISENEYLKIDVMNKIVNYAKEIYEIKLTNRSNYTVVVSDDQELNEIRLVLPNETRTIEQRFDVVLQPRETQTIKVAFPKFSDDGDMSQKIAFSSIRVMEKYSGTGVDEAIIQSEIDNAITKFSMEVGIGER